MENDSTFVAPEGVYSATEDHKPLAPTHVSPPPIYPTRIASVSVRFPAKQSVPGLGQLLGGSKDFWKDRPQQHQHQHQPASHPPLPVQDGVSVSSSETPDDGTSPDNPVPHSPQDLPHADHARSLFSSSPSSHGPSPKRRSARPKHNMRTTSSSFVTRIHGADGLARTLASKHGDVTYLFYTSAKNFYWSEAGVKAKEPLARIAFSAYPTCHDVNQATASHEHLDIIVGFQTGDLVWFDPVSLRYARINKQGRISSSPCTAVRWVPDSAHLFLVAHADGCIIVYDKDRDDGAFVPSAPTAPESTGEWNPLDSMFVTMPPWHHGHDGAAAASGREKDRDKEKAAKNPVSHWRVSQRAIVDFVFSPDVKYVAAIAEDGCLRVIDALAEQLMDCYAAYFGALTCVAWSPDGRFIITGGQDDLVNIFSPWEGRVIARCQGHSSFVSAVAFDDVRCDGRTYRFGSVGEDNKLLLWDFSSGILHRPKLQTSHHQRVSMSSTLSLALRRREGAADRSTLHLVPEGPLPKYHPAPSRNEVAVVQPVLVKQLESEQLLYAIAFLPRYLITAAKTGHVRLWVRPLVAHPRARSGATPRSANADAEDVG
ncbi:WD40 repeat-like protein [Vararia minispora EC-137]|uniref:WD40 repeat-like protein n=1 Tax=Vararia minispora EC-137 TaxID=1314806 RepID=A0ACB8QK69_9AGAM|nr:WD40 repeat-like protein [Vararia minispora EC-137]